jgi:hypothetical protein
MVAQPARPMTRPVTRLAEARMRELFTHAVHSGKLPSHCTCVTKNEREREASLDA